MENVLMPRIDVKATPKTKPVDVNLKVPRTSTAHPGEVGYNNNAQRITYWIKYAGVVDGAMGILTRREDILRCIANSRLRKYTTTSTGEVGQDQGRKTNSNGKAGKSCTKNTKNKSQQQKYKRQEAPVVVKSLALQWDFPNSERNCLDRSLSPQRNYLGKLQKLSANSAKGHSVAWGEYKSKTGKVYNSTKSKLSSLLMHSFRRKKRQKSTIEERKAPIQEKNEDDSNPKLAEHLVELQSVADSFLDTGTALKKSKTLQDSHVIPYSPEEPERTPERVTGIPNPSLYNVYLVTNYMKSKKLCSIPRRHHRIHESVGESFSNYPQITRPRGMVGNKRLELLSQLSFNQPRSKEVSKGILLPNYRSGTAANEVPVRRMKKWELFREKILQEKPHFSKKKTQITRPTIRSRVERQSGCRTQLAKKSPLEFNKEAVNESISGWGIKDAEALEAEVLYGESWLSVYHNSSASSKPCEKNIP